VVIEGLQLQVEARDAGLVVQLTVESEISFPHVVQRGHSQHATPSI
jgi:hypothetical protein